jgi:hypothetical protein
MDNNKGNINLVFSDVVNKFHDFHKILNEVNLSSMSCYKGFTHCYLEVNLKLVRLQTIVSDLVDVICERRNIDKDELRLQLLDIKKELLEINNYIDNVVKALEDLKINNTVESDKINKEFKSKLSDFEDDIYYTCIMAAIADIIELSLLNNDSSKEEIDKRIEDIRFRLIQLKIKVSEIETVINRLLLYGISNGIDYNLMTELNSKLKNIDFMKLLKNAF